MNEYNRTILTDEPLAWQLTNEQRKRIGIPPIERSWRLSEVPCGLLADKETYVYTDGNRIQRVISASETFYLEVCIDVTLTEDGRIPPCETRREIHSADSGQPAQAPENRHLYPL